jgi:uncharacterized protein YqgC (DUF456 family)
MNIFLIILGAVLLIIGFAGSFLPIIPGPPIAYLGLIALQLTSNHPFSALFLVIWALIVIFLQVLDHLIPAWMTKRSGGSKYGIWGTIVGGIIGGILFPPLGIIIGPLAGAFLGEILAGKDTAHATKTAWASFVGFLLNTGIKIIAVGVMGFYFVTAA